MLNRIKWIAALAACLLLTGCEDSSPVAQKETDAAAAESNNDSGPPTDEGTEPAQPETDADGGLNLTPATGAPANGNTGGGLGDLTNANPFKNEPTYNGPGASGNPNSGNPAAPGGGTGNNNATYRPAGVGSGKKGRSLENETGVGRMIASPAVSFFRTRERLTFNVQIPQALQLYKATNGRLPKSHQEFMSKIIQANRIQLPELPAGQRYVFDPQAGQLMVEYPEGSR